MASKVTIGARNGRLTCTGLAANSPNESIRVAVRCDCGTEKIIRKDCFWRTRSCGCIKQESCGKRNPRLEAPLDQCPVWRAAVDPHYYTGLRMPRTSPKIGVFDAS